jgi:nucleoside-diphosphate-sugar epimerase
VKASVLVTGCAGFIGSTLTDALLASGHVVRGVDAFTDYYDPGRKRDNLRGARQSSNFEMVEADVTNADLTALLEGIDVVYHLAGQPGVRVSWSDGFAVYVTHNVLATQRLLEAVRSRPVRRFVYASSSSVYGNATQYPVTEIDLPQPHSPYGVTKLAAEHLCSLYADNWDLPTVSLRYFSVYGPRQRPDMGFDRFFDAVLHDRPIPVFGTGKQVRDFTYVDDVVAATIAAGSAEIAPGAVCNIAGGSSVSVEELIPMINDIAGRCATVERLPAQPGDVDRTGGSIVLARELLGWEPQMPLRDGLIAQFETIQSRSK